MPTLLPELAEALAESNRRAAAWIDAEAAAAEQMQRTAEPPALPTYYRNLARLSAVTSEEVVAEAEKLAEIWSVVIRGLREHTPTDQLTILEGVGEIIDAFQQRLVSATHFAAVAVPTDEPSGAAAQLDAAADRMRRLRAEISKAIEARTKPWQPKDPERFEKGLRQAAEGQAVGPDEARTWFRRTSE